LDVAPDLRRALSRELIHGRRAIAASVVAGGQVYAVDFNSNVYAFGLKSE
jgi:hypothetical protein